MKVLMVEPGKSPYAAEIRTGSEILCRRAVGRRYSGGLSE